MWRALTEHNAEGYGRGAGVTHVGSNLPLQLVLVLGSWEDSLNHEPQFSYLLNGEGNNPSTHLTRASERIE